MAITGSTEGLEKATLANTEQVEISRMASMVVSGQTESSGVTSVVVSRQKKFKDDLCGSAKA